MHMRYSLQGMQLVVKLIHLHAAESDRSDVAEDRYFCLEMRFDLSETILAFEVIESRKRSEVDPWNLLLADFARPQQIMHLL